MRSRRMGPVRNWLGLRAAKARTAETERLRNHPTAVAARENMARLQRAAQNQRHVREQVTDCDPSLARALDGLFTERTDREPRQQRETKPVRTRGTR